MFRQRTLKQTLSATRAGLVAAAALALVVGTVGVPLPTGRPKDRSIAFPCMDRACGCHDAADCKAHCCCFSSDEKLAWAAEHGVDAEPFVDRSQCGDLPSGDFSTVAADSLALEGAGRSCCHKQIASCCSSKGTRLTGRPDATNAQEPACDRVNSDRLLSISAYRQCNGFGFLWSVLSAALAPPKPVGYEFEWLMTGRVAPWNAVTSSLSFSPPTPPPRA